MEDKKVKRVCVYFDDETVRLSDAGAKLINSKSRSDFIGEAVKYYSTFLMKENTAEVLTPALESVIHASVKDTENHLSRVLYKQAIANAMIMHVMAEVYDIDVKRLDEIRSVCVREINRLNGKFKFEDAVDYEG